MRKKEKTVVLKNEGDTLKLAKELASSVEPGSIIALIGNLGVGKTTFSKYFAREIGIGETVQSPTFTVVREYRNAELPLYHFDVYRVNDEDELFEMGFFEYIDKQDGVCLIEWADLIMDMLPKETLIVEMDYGNSEGERIVKIYSKEAKA